MEMKEVVLETERLRLRWFREDDFADFCDICAEPEVMHFLGDGKPMMPMEVMVLILDCIALVRWGAAMPGDLPEFNRQRGG